MAKDRNAKSLTMVPVPRILMSTGELSEAPFSTTNSALDLFVAVARPAASMVSPNFVAAAVLAGSPNMTAMLLLFLASVTVWVEIGDELLNADPVTTSIFSAVLSARATNAVDWRN